MTRSRTWWIALVASAGIGASALLNHRGAIQSSQNESVLRQQERQLLQLLTENQRLSNLVAQASSEPTPPADYAGELARLRIEADGLRETSNRLSRQLTEARLHAGVQFFASGDARLSDHNKDLANTIAGGPRASGKLNDARALTAALRKYADEHKGELPASLDQATAYLPKPLDRDSPSWANAPLSGTNDFELVYRGSLHELAGIPPRRVALIREPQAWLSPNEKPARTYGFADGSATVVESDDNFATWDAQHIVPSPPGD
jgi:hypothetical protein